MTKKPHRPSEKSMHASRWLLLSRAEMAATGLFLFGSLLMSALISIMYPIALISAFTSFIGLAYVLFLPGYIFVRSFLAHHDPVEKLALSFGMSVLFVIAVISIANILLNIDITPLVNILLVLIVIAGILAARLLTHLIAPDPERKKYRA